jgi:hypothetical protein
MFAQRFTQYVIATSVSGGIVGLGHALGTQTKMGRQEAAFYYGISGLVAGPWAPIIVPAVVLGLTNTVCPRLRLR